MTRSQQSLALVEDTVITEDSGFSSLKSVCSTDLHSGLAVDLHHVIKPLQEKEDKSQFI